MDPETQQEPTINESTSTETPAKGDSAQEMPQMSENPPAQREPEHMRPLVIAIIGTLIVLGSLLFVYLSTHAPSPSDDKLQVPSQTAPTEAVNASPTAMPEPTEDLGEFNDLNTVDLDGFETEFEKVEEELNQL